MIDFDVVIVGSGFAGSLLAMIARRLGRSVLLLERGSHPRFAIGESSTPLANLLLEQLADRYDLPRIRPLSKWGAWQLNRPEIACGLKRGFSFFHHRCGEPFVSDERRRNQLLVGASPTDQLGDTHWYRPDFDQFLVQEAQALGVEYLDHVNLSRAACEAVHVRVDGERFGQSLAARARLLIDATGPRGFLHRSLGLAELPFENLPRTQALFSHFRGVERLDKLGLVAEGETPPYPIDDAAVHHVFDGGWVWVLRFNNGLTSAGIAATDALAHHLGLAQGGTGWNRVLQRFPTLGQQFAEAQAAVPFIHMPHVGFRSATVAGPNWALLPSAAGFVDPLLSTGFTLTLLGVTRLAQLIGEQWGDASSKGLHVYARRTTRELLVVERLVAALYASMCDFESFALLSLLYFAPVSFAEIAHRLGRPDLASSFLLCDEPRFGATVEQLLKDALALLRSGGLPAQQPCTVQGVRKAIEPFDAIGLSNESRRNWHPSLDADLLAAAHKFGVDRGEMQRFLRS